MSLDVYVTPMWRFKAGDVETAVQRLFGDQSHVITPRGILRPERIKGFFAKRRAKRQVRAIVAEAEKELNVSIHWNDDGETVHAEQASWGFEAFRAYAKWLDLREFFPTFDEPPNGNFYEHPAMKCKGEPSRQFRFSHIIDHSCHSGYFVPCQFDRVVYVEPFQAFGGRFTFRHSFGSSFTLGKQLNAIAELMPTANASDLPESTRELVVAGFDTLNRLASNSIKHQLPIIFWG